MVRGCFRVDGVWVLVNPPGKPIRGRLGALFGRGSIPLPVFNSLFSFLEQLILVHNHNDLIKVILEKYA